MLYQVGAVILFAAALFGMFIASLAAAGENCGSCTEQHWQANIAVVGLVSVGAMNFFTFRRRWRTAAIALVLSIVLYAIWGVIFDAAVRGSNALIPF